MKSFLAKPSQSVLRLAFILMLSSSVFSTIKTFAQDNIYTSDKTIIKGKIVGFEGEDIVYIEEASDKVINKKLNTVVVIFNNKGNFLLPDELLTKPENRTEVISEYFNSPQLSTKYDLLIYKNPVDLVRCTITYESEEVVNFKTIKTGEGRTVNKKELLLIIYMNGNHSFFSEPSPFASELKLLKEKIKQKAIADENEEPTSVAVDTPQAIVTTPTTVEKEPIAVPKPVVNNPTLNEEEYQAYRGKAKVKVDDFMNFLNIITNKDLDASEKDKVIEQTIKLFTPNSTIQVSMKMPDGTVRVTTRKVEDYLKRLKLSPYSSVNIEWTDVQYVSELKQEDDGNYYGTISGEQRFTGYDKTGDVKYTDVTQKNVKVMVKSYKKVIEAMENQKWDVFLGNIAVVETK